VTQASANERQGEVRVSGRAGRWVSRALLVLGGIAAGTAAAWAVSAATASADTMIATSGANAVTNVDATPITDATVSGLNDVTHGVSGLAGNTAGTVVAAWHDTACQQNATTWSAAAEQLHPLPAWCAQLDREEVGGPLRVHGTHRTPGEALGQDVAGRVGDAVNDFTATAVTRPVKTTLGAVERIVTKPQDVGQVLGETLTPVAQDQDLGHQVWDLFNPNNGAGQSTAPGEDHPGEPAAATTPAANISTQSVTVKAAPSAPGERDTAKDLTTGGEQPDGHHNFPAPFSPVQFPLAPLSAPSVPGGSGPGGHFDGPAFGIPAWSAAAFGNAMAGLVRAGVRYMPLTPGSQPGVTPD
jgi:hypothetical protein